jgi:hypothetical protein
VFGVFAGDLLLVATIYCIRLCVKYLFAM